MSGRFSKYPKAKAIQSHEFRLGGDQRRLDGGLNVYDLPFGLDSCQSSAMLNLWYRDGSLTKRFGQSEFSRTPKNLAAYSCVSDNRGTVYLCTDGKIYSLDMETKRYRKLYELSALHQNGEFTLYGPNVYFVNGERFLSCTPTAVTEIEPYIPIVIISRTPDGVTNKGCAYESFNSLTDKFRIVFDCDGVSNSFHLPECDEYISVQAQNGTSAVYDPASRILTCQKTPLKGETITVTVKKAGAGSIYGDTAGIYACTKIAAFAGDGRIYLCANGTNIIYPSAPARPDYFPTDLASRAGNGEELTAFGRQYDMLILFKKRETLCVDLSSASCTVKCVNPIIGCDMAGSIQTVANRLVFANTYGGAYIVVSTNRENERNIQPISRNIDPLLLSNTTSELQNATSVCFDGKYWLCVGTHVYLWDYTSRPYVYSGSSDSSARKLGWYYFNSIDGGAWFEYYNTLYVCARKDGRIAFFERKFDDFGTAIMASWKSPVLDFGLPHVYKSIENVWFICRGDTNCRSNIRYIFNRYDGAESLKEPKLLDLRSFNWYDFKWSGFLWPVAGMFKTIARHPRKKRVLQFSVEQSDASIDADLSVVDVVIAYRDEFKIG